MSALLAYVAAVQTLLYLDLRMRREGLDLAMRFDCVPIPQPSAPPPASPAGLAGRSPAMTGWLVRRSTSRSASAATRPGGGPLDELAKAKYGGTPEWVPTRPSGPTGCCERLVEFVLG